MSHSNHHFLAILPLFAILSISPMHLDSKIDTGRTIASEVIVAHPKYEARAAKIDRTKIVIDKDLDLNCFSDRGEALRNRLLEERKNYKVDVVEKEAVAQQRGRIDSLVSSLVDLEEDMKVLKEKKAWEKDGQEIADKTMAELKTTLESLLQDEIENELAVLKETVKKEEAPKVTEATPEKPAAEAEKPAKEEPKKDDALCELEEKNLVLTKQVEELLAQQKTIMETMMGMTNMMVKMSQQQQGVEPWMRLSAPPMNPQQMYPYLPGQGAGQWVFYPQSIMPTVMNNMQYGQVSEPNVQTTLGQQGYQQSAQSPSLNFSPIPYQPSYVPSTFGTNPNSFNFSPNLATNNMAVNFGVGV